MQITIVNSRDLEESALKQENEIRLLWTAILTGKVINHVSPMGMLLDFHIEHPRRSEKQRIAFYKMHYSEHGDEKMSTRLDEVYKFLKKARNNKRKNKQMLVALAQAEKELKGIDDVFMNAIKRKNTDLNLQQLTPYITEEDEPGIWSWVYQDYRTAKEKRWSIIGIMSTTFIDANELPFYDNTIADICTLAEMESGNYAELFSEKGLSFIRTPLFEIPPPESLTTDELRIARRDITAGFKEFMAALQELSKELRLVPYGHTTLAGAAGRVKELLSEYKPGLQKTIDDNLYMQKLKSRNPAAGTYAVSLCISSIKCLVEAYTAMKIIDKPAELYIKEETGTKLDLNSCCLFLYLTVNNGK